MFNVAGVNIVITRHNTVRIRRKGEIVVSALVFKFMSPIVNLISVTYIYTQSLVTRCITFI